MVELRLLVLVVKLLPAPLRQPVPMRAQLLVRQDAFLNHHPLAVMEPSQAFQSLEQLADELLLLVICIEVFLIGHHPLDNGAVLFLLTKVRQVVDMVDAISAQLLLNDLEHAGRDGRSLM